ncbi:MAG TPA: OmpH family outer membrane protein [Terracidiphilus sp.]|jgi:outer membrane protein
MKRLPLFVLFCAAASVIPASSQTPSPAAQRPNAAVATGPAKVAVIAFQAAVSQTNEFQRDFADLQKKYDPKRQQLKTLSDQIDTLSKQLQDQGPQLGEEERISRARTIDDKKKQLDRDTQDAQSDFQGDLQQLINGVAAKVGALMTDYAQKQGYTIVLDAGDQQNATVLYAVPSTDITKAIIEAYNVKSGIPAPPPEAPGANQPAVDAPQPQPAPAH